VFAFGVTLLEICLLRSMELCFDLQEFKVKDVVLWDKISELSNHYSLELQKFVHLCLVLNEES